MRLFEIAQRKFSHEKWRLGEYDIGWNDIKRGVSVVVCQFKESFVSFNIGSEIGSGGLSSYSRESKVCSPDQVRL